MMILAIFLAATGAIGLAVGTHLQHRAVHRSAQPGDGARLSPRTRTARVLRNPLWLLGLGVLATQMLLSIAALGLAPVAVVQPIGSLALVCAVIISAIALRVRVNRSLLLGIGLSVAAVCVFVGISARFVLDVRPNGDAVALLACLLLCFILLGVLTAHQFHGHLARVAAAGVIFGTVAAACHLVSVELIARVQQAGIAVGADSFLGNIALALPQRAEADGAAVSVTQLWQLVVLLIIASAIGMWLVQTAYASGPPETVLASLTVLDPIVAVFIGALLLGEYGSLPASAALGLAVSGVVACLGIVVIAKHHPALHTSAALPRPVTPQSRIRSGVASQNRRS